MSSRDFAFGDDPGHLHGSYSCGLLFSLALWLLVRAGAVGACKWGCAIDKGIRMEMCMSFPASSHVCGFGMEASGRWIESLPKRFATAIAYNEQEAGRN